jgi:PAS domain S-box-containing protein
VAGTTDAFLSGGGKLGAMIRGRDWAATPLGPIEAWPQSLRTSVSTCLNCTFPILIWWGPDLIKIYNDAYAEIIADKHPWALGRPGREVWPEIWDIIGPGLDGVLQRGEAFPANDLRLVLQRRGYPEECYFSFSYSPIRDETGGVGGVFCPVIETTPRVLAERRSGFLLAFEARLRDIADPASIKRAASEMLGKYLGVNQVGYAEVTADGAHVFVDGEYEDGVAPSTRGLHRLDDYGPDMIADLRAGRIVRVSNVRQDPRTRDPATLPAYEKYGLAAFLNVPLNKAGQLRSVLFVNHFAPRQWTDDEVAHVRDVAERTWSAVERAHAELALRRSEEEFRALGENLPNLCWMARADGWVYWYNRAWYDYTGTRPPELEGWDWQRLHHADWLPRTMQVWTEAIAAGARVDTTFPLLGADGRYRPFLTRIAPVRDDTGTITRWFGAMVDISDLQDAEERLRVSETKLRRLNETLERQVAARTAERDRMWRLSTDIMLVAKMDCTIVAANPAWTTMLGWHEDELRGRSFLDFIHPDDTDSTARSTLNLSQGRTVRQFENRYRHRDGGYRWIAWSAVPDADLMHGVGRDVTAEKEAAAQLEAAQERLRQAQRMEALGQLAGGIAHDFNNVLQSVAGGLRMIRKRAQDPAAVAQMVDMVADVTARGAAVTGRLLSFARQSELQSVPVDPASLLEGLAEILLHTLGAGIRVRTETAPDTPHLLADKAQLETVLVNLAVNARDAMPHGGELVIAAQAETVAPANPHGLAAGAYVRLTLTDTGCGMDSATLARAGEPFFTTKAFGKGTGLGLAMARGFCTQSGGGFSLRSTVGQGTTVTLWLPQTDSVGDAARPAAQHDPCVQREAAGRVLLVDDDAIVRLALAEHLADIGCAVTQAADGLCALAHIDAGATVDLMVTDFAMPGMNGLTLIEEARRRLPSLPVILLTGFADTGVRESLADGALRDALLLQKPISPDALAERAVMLLGEKERVVLF